MSWGTKAEERLPPSAFFKPLKEIKITTGLKIAAWGPPESGKTYLCCSAPAPVYISSPGS